MYINSKNKTYNVGDILKVFKFPVWHYGIFDGKEVIHASKERGKVCRDSLNNFLGGEKPKIIRKKASDNDKKEAVRYANLQIGREYALFSDNCEHFVNECYGDKHSSQVAFVTLAAFGMLAWLFGR